MSDERHASVDFEIVPDLVCGRSYRNPESEALAVAMRAGEVTPYTGCGKPLRWVYAYRCRQCGRWLHGPCMDRHFGGVDLTAELAASQAREQALREAGAGVIVSREWEDEIRARDHSLRQAGAFVLRLFDALAAQDQAIGSGRANRSTPLGELLHDCAPLVENYRVRTVIIESMRSALAERGER